MDDTRGHRSTEPRHGTVVVDRTPKVCPSAPASRNSLAVAVVTALFLLQAGCAMGPKTLDANRAKYNESSTKTDREQLLVTQETIHVVRAGPKPKRIIRDASRPDLRWQHRRIVGWVVLTEQPTISVTVDSIAFEETARGYTPPKIKQLINRMSAID